MIKVGSWKQEMLVEFCGCAESLKWSIVFGRVLLEERPALLIMRLRWDVYSLKKKKIGEFYCEATYAQYQTFALESSCRSVNDVAEPILNSWLALSLVRAYLACSFFFFWKSSRSVVGLLHLWPFSLDCNRFASCDSPELHHRGCSNFCSSRYTILVISYPFVSITVVSKITITLLFVCRFICL